MTLYGAPLFLFSLLLDERSCLDTGMCASLLEGCLLGYFSLPLWVTLRGATVRLHGG